MGCCFIETRDKVVLGKIVGYCRRIAGYLERYQHDYSTFERDPLFQDACCMCVVQIGELAGQLSEDAKAKGPAIPWRVIKDTRNFYVHAYGAIDVRSVWETLNEDIPALQLACEKIFYES